MENAKKNAFRLQQTLGYVGKCITCIELFKKKN